MTRTRLAIVATIAVLALGSVLTWLLWPKPSVKIYDTAVRAVTIACHAATFLPGFPAMVDRSGHIEIGWIEKGQDEGTGWAALVVQKNGGYTVQNCKFKGVAHG